MSQPKWTVVNGVKWEISHPSKPHTTPNGGKKITPVLWSPILDIENPMPTFTHQGKVYNEICELTLEEALRFIK